MNRERAAAVSLNEMEEQAPRTRSGPAASLRRIVTALVVIGLLVILGVCLASVAGRSHYLELASHFRMQAFVGAVVLLVTLAVLRRWIMAVVAGGIIAFAAWPLLPLWLGGSAPSGGHESTVRLLLANVLTENTNTAGMLAEIERQDPDIIVLQEVNRRWVSAMEPLFEAYPHTVQGPREDNFGILMLSRLPLSDASIDDIGDAEVPTIRASVDVGDAQLRIVATHPLPPLSKYGFDLRNRQLDALAGVLDDEPRPLVLLGDLNTTMWSPYYRDLAEAADLRNARLGFGVLATWPTDFPGIMRIPIDHCLVSDGVSVLDCRTGEHVGSDHLPLVVDVKVDRTGGKGD